MYLQSYLLLKLLIIYMYLQSYLLLKLHYLHYLQVILLKLLIIEVTHY